MKFKKGSNLQRSSKNKAINSKNSSLSNKEIFGAVLADSVIFNQMF